MVTEVTQKKRYNRKQALASEPQWSQYQTAVFDWLEKGRGNLRVGAVAGSGKTTSIVGIINRLPSDAKVTVLAFNVHIVEALKAKGLPTRIAICTAHGMGNALLNRHFAGEGLKLEENKYRKISREFVADLNIDKLIESSARNSESYDQAEKRIRRELNDFLCEIVRFCQSTLTEPTIDNIKRLVDHYSIESVAGDYLVYELVPQVLLEGERLAASDRVIDFSDMLWLPHMWNIQPSSRDFVIVDEIQDANNAQLSLYRKLIGDTGRLIAIGDPAQSIMGFSGAGTDMWERVKAETKATDLPLSVCYRCPSSHLDLARFIVAHIEARQDAPEGTIEVLHPKQIKETVQSGDLIICRFTAPLVELCLRLIVKKVQAKVRGRDIGAQLAGLALKAGSDVPFNQFSQALNTYCLAQIELLKEKDNDKATENLEDRYQAIKACYDEFGKECRGVNQFCDRIRALFTDESTPVTLSTIHRAKGDEADRVFLLGCNQLPYTDKCVHEWQEQQELNLLYVALTRAKQSLFLVPLLRKKGGNLEELETLCRQPLGGLEIQPTPFIPVSSRAEMPVQTVDVEVVESDLQVNDAVTNSKNWTGRITKIEPDCQTSEDGFYYWVHWLERENHAEAGVRRHPACGHLRQDIRRAV